MYDSFLETAVSETHCSSPTHRSSLPRAGAGAGITLMLSLGVAGSLIKATIAGASDWCESYNNQLIKIIFSILLYSMLIISGKISLMKYPTNSIVDFTSSIVTFSSPG